MRVALYARVACVSNGGNDKRNTQLKELRKYATATTRKWNIYKEYVPAGDMVNDVMGQKKRQRPVKMTEFCL